MSRIDAPAQEEFRPELYDAIAPGYYDAVYRRGAGIQWFWHHHRFAQVEARLPNECRRLLDLGCGPGTFLGRLERPLDYALGLDLAAAQIAHANALYGGARREFRVADVRDLSLVEPFDAIVSIEVIEHLPPAATADFLAAIQRLLRPGGTVVLTTPNYRSLWPLLERLVSAKGPVDYRRQHINRFRRDRLADELRHAGFEQVRCETFFALAPFLAGVSRRLAETVLAAERRWLPRAGAELVVSAIKPVDGR